MSGETVSSSTRLSAEMPLMAVATVPGPRSSWVLR
ncbi:hypothetical protein STENM327S_04456 [Streptomyces tendae]